MPDRRGTWAIAIVLLLVVFLLLSRCTGSNGSTRVGAVPNNQGPAEPAPVTATRVPATGVADGSDASDDDASVLTVGGRSVFPLSAADGVGTGGDLTLLAGKQAVARDARVLTVPADEGFWIGTGPANRVFVQLTGLPPESPYKVHAGDRVSFEARITPNGTGFAREVGVTAAEGARTLTAQHQHLNVPKRALSLQHP